MKLVMAVFAAILFVDGAAVAADCAVPPSLIASDSDLARVIAILKTHHQFDISVVGTGSSTLPGPDGASFAYPARLGEALRQRLPGYTVKLSVHVRMRQTTADMAADLKHILAEDKPALVVWQAGTFDAVDGVDPEQFRSSLDAGVDAINSAGADVDLVNMQYSPRTESMLDVSSYADVMRLVAQERGTLLFDRQAIMRYWNDEGIFDLYAATKNSDMARRVHDCIGRALASQIIDAAHLTP
jgi:hypothetical protein